MSLSALSVVFAERILYEYAAIVRKGLKFTKKCDLLK